MKYITKVIIENYQSHKYSVIEFDKYLNVIIGPSDQGKSSIIRAIKWVLYNEPTGTFFIREGERECSVTLFFNDNTKLKRLRTPSKNLYILYDENGKESIYEGFGTNVPDEIIDKTKIRKVYLDGNQSTSINIADQLEGPFLLSEKTSVRANAIGRLVGVHIIDKAIANTLKDIRNLNTKKKSVEDKLKELTGQYEKYDYLEELKLVINKVEKIEKVMKYKNQKLKKLSEIKEKCNSILNEKASIQETIKELKSIDILESKILELDKKVNQIKYLRKINQQYLYLGGEIKKNESVKEGLKNTGKVEVICNKLQISMQTKNNLERLNKIYRTIQDNIESNMKCLKNIKGIENIENMLMEASKIYSRLNDLLKLKMKYNDTNKRILVGKKYTEALSTTEKVDVYYNDLKKKINNLDSIIKLRDKYALINRELKRLTEEFNVNNKEIQSLLSKYSSLLKEIELCPLCLNRIDSNNIEKIINSLK